MAGVILAISLNNIIFKTDTMIVKGGLMKKNKVFITGMAVITLVVSLGFMGCDVDDDDEYASLLPPVTQDEFRALVQNTATRTINLTAGSDVTLTGVAINATRLTINVAPGATLRDYWKIGAKRYVVVYPGGNLRWGEGEVNNLFVGAGNSTANLRLGSGTFTVIGKANDEADYELSGCAGVYQQNGEPLVVDQNQIFTIVTGKLTVTRQLGEDLANIKPVLSVHATGGTLIIENFATLELVQGALVVLGDGADSLQRELSGIILDNAGPGFEAGTAAGTVGILNAALQQVTGL
jgi:hypothetical protein